MHLSCRLLRTRYSQKMHHLQTEETHTKWPTKLPVSNFQGDLVAYHSWTVRLYSSNLVYLTSVNCHGLPGTLAPYSWTYLETSWILARDKSVGVKLMFSCTVPLYHYSPIMYNWLLTRQQKWCTSIRVVSSPVNSWSTTLYYSILN